MLKSHPPGSNKISIGHRPLWGHCPTNHLTPTYTHIGATGTADHLTLLRLFLFSTHFYFNLILIFLFFSFLTFSTNSALSQIPECSSFFYSSYQNFLLYILLSLDYLPYSFLHYFIVTRQIPYKSRAIVKSLSTMSSNDFE